MTEPIEYAALAEERPTTRQIFIAWEKLRIVYIGVLAIPTILILISVLNGGRRPFGVVAFNAIVGAVTANLCYFAGPAVESYANWLGMRSTMWLRVTLFVLGTLFSLLLGVPFLIFSAAF